MKRKIAFRAWDKEKKEMLSWNDLQNNQVGFVHSLIGEGNWIVMQSTGLLDKNGKEVFEGDIVLISEDENKKASNTPHETFFLFGDKAQVYFDEVNANFVLLNDDEGEETSIGYYAGWSSWNWLTVIGNVWEHPHLLKGESL